MWWKGLLAFPCFVPYECKWGRSELISSSHIRRIRGTPVSLGNSQRGQPVGFSDIFKDLAFSSQVVSHTALYWIPNSRFSAEELQPETRISMTLVFCVDELRCYLYDHKAKASLRVGNGSQDQFHYISDSHFCRKDLSVVTGWHTLKLHVYFLTLIPWKRCVWSNQHIRKDSGQTTSLSAKVTGVEQNTKC